MLRFISESSRMNGTKDKPKFCKNLVMSALEREKNAQAQVCYTRCTSPHKRKKCQSQENAKDVAALTHKTLYKRNKKDHKMIAPREVRCNLQPSVDELCNVT
jgi:hypothetical protein